MTNLKLPNDKSMTNDKIDRLNLAVEYMNQAKMTETSIPSWYTPLKNLLGDSVSCQVSSSAEFCPGPTVVCTPETDARLSATIQFAALNRIPIVPFGGATAQTIGRKPPANAIFLSTRALSNLFHHEPGDMVATAQAGMELGAFQRILGLQGQWLPLDGNPKSTLGGLVATAHAGPLAPGYGSMRDMVLGMTVVNGDGEIRKCGSKVVKNVTGYALEKLYIGSLGTLGVVTEVTFKLRPLPISRSGWHFPVADLADGAEVMRLIDAKNLPLEMLHLFSRAGHGFCENLDFSTPFQVIVSAAGSSDELDRIDREITEALTPRRAQRFPCSISPIDFSPFNQSNIALSNSPNIELATHAEYTSINVPWASRPPVAKSQAYERTGGRDARDMNDLHTYDYASTHATLQFWCLKSALRPVIALVCSTAASSTDMGPPGRHSLSLTGGTCDLWNLSDERVNNIAIALTELNVNFRFENIVGLTIGEPFGRPRPEWALMKKIKDALDPQGIMNPGRFVV